MQLAEAFRRIFLLKPLMYGSSETDRPEGQTDRHGLKLLSAPRRESCSCPKSRQLWPSPTHSQPPTRRVVCGLRKAFVPERMAACWGWHCGDKSRAVQDMRWFVMKKPLKKQVQGESMSFACAPCHTTLQRDFRPRHLPGWGPFGVESTARFPSGPGPGSELHTFPQGSRSQKVFLKRGQIFKTIVHSVPSVPHSRAVVRTRKGAPESGPLTCALTFSFLLTLLYLPHPVSSPPAPQLPLLCG